MTPLLEFWHSNCLKPYCLPNLWIYECYMIFVLLNNPAAMAKLYISSV